MLPKETVMVFKNGFYRSTYKTIMMDYNPPSHCLYPQNKSFLLLISYSFFLSHLSTQTKENKEEKMLLSFVT